MNIQKYLDLFESQETKERGQWWSFKLDAINSEDKKYQALSEVIRESALDEDNAYKFTVQALGAIEDMKIAFEDDARKTEGTKFEDYITEPEIVEQFSEAPIYNYDLMQWVSKHNNYTFIDDVVDEYGNDVIENGIITLVSIAYRKAWEEHYYKVLEIVKA